MKNTPQKKTVTSSFRIQNFGKPRENSPIILGKTTTLGKPTTPSEPKIPLKVETPKEFPDAAIDYERFRPKETSNRDSFIKIPNQARDTNNQRHFQPDILDSRSNGESNSDSGCPSASSDDDISDVPTPTSHSSPVRPNLFDTGTSRKYFGNKSFDSSMTTEYTPIRPIMTSSRFTRQSSLPGESMELTNTLSTRMRRDSMTSSSESIDSVDSFRGNVQPRVERLLGRLRRGSSSVHRSDVDNVIPLSARKLFDQRNLDTAPMRRASNSVVFGGRAPQVTAARMGSGDVDNSAVPGRRYRHISEPSLGYKPPDQRDRGRSLPPDAMQRLRRLSSGSFNNDDNDDQNNSNNRNNNSRYNNSIIINNNDNNNKSYNNNNNNSSIINNNNNNNNNNSKNNNNNNNNFVRKIDTTINDDVIGRARYGFRPISQSDVTSSDISEKHHNTAPLRMEMKTQIRPIVEKFTVTRTITGTANPTVRRVGRSGSIVMRSLPTSRSQSPTRDENDVDDIEMALAIRKAFENAPWRTDY